MSTPTADRSLRAYARAISARGLNKRLGRVFALSGQGIESNGPEALLGEICEIVGTHGRAIIKTEVVGVHADHLTLMPYGSTQGVGRGDQVIGTGRSPQVAVGPALLGRVIDAFGQPVDDGPPIAWEELRSINATCPNPLSRPPIRLPLETGVRAIDTLLTIGQGQRLGIFAGSGVGKSTLLGMLVRQVRSDVNVVALIGERGREVREFIDRQLGEAGLKRSVVVAATSDQPALARYRAAHTATTIAEYFRDQGAQVLLTMDSVTRFAMARREIGLSAGEPPTARGYTPSVFAEIPPLCERCGTVSNGGAITALYTVLVEGDDMNEPIADMLRATLDGHIVLSRELAHAGHFPAIDVLKSVSRLAPDVSSDQERDTAQRLLELMAVLDKNKSLVDLGVYQKGSNPKLDGALAIQDSLNAFLRQPRSDCTKRRDAVAALRRLVESASSQGVAR
jgi:flagellum-specific ATP synthase